MSVFYNKPHRPKSLNVIMHLDLYYLFNQHIFPL